MPMHFPKPLLLLTCCVALTGCAAVTSPAPDSGGADRVRNEGYSLLYKLMSDESKVGQIFILKSASASVTDVVKEVGNSCQTYKKQLDDFAAADNGMHLNMPDLPIAEQQSRDLIAGSQTRSLLISSGREFEVQLLITQVQAMDYASHLAKAIERHEEDKDRKQFLTDLSARCAGYHDQLVKLLVG
jgi:hypothetical protein